MTAIGGGPKRPRPDRNAFHPPKGQNRRKPATQSYGPLATPRPDRVLGERRGCQAAEGAKRAKSPSVPRLTASGRRTRSYPDPGLEYHPVRQGPPRSFLRLMWLLHGIARYFRRAVNAPSGGAPHVPSQRPLVPPVQRLLLQHYRRPPRQTRTRRDQGPYEAPAHPPRQAGGPAPAMAVGNLCDVFLDQFEAENEKDAFEVHQLFPSRSATSWARMGGFPAVRGRPGLLASLPGELRGEHPRAGQGCGARLPKLRREKAEHTALFPAPADCRRRPLASHSAMTRAYSTRLSGVPYRPSRTSRRAPRPSVSVTMAWPDCLCRR